MMKRKSRKVDKWAVICGLVLVVPAITATFPFVYMVLKSLEQTQVLSMVFRWDKMNLDNYRNIFQNMDFMRYTMNSMIVAVCACALNCLFCTMAAFGFEKKKFPGKEGIFFLFIITLMLPGQVTLIPVFVIMRQLGLLNTYAALFLPIINAFGVFLVRQFMVGLPNDLLEAAQIDGSGEFSTFFRIVLPLQKPVLISLTVFTFLTIWNDFLWPLVVTTDAKMHTLTLALSVMNSTKIINYGLVMAGSLLTFIFPFVLYLLLQKQFMEGIALSGIKG